MHMCLINEVLNVHHIITFVSRVYNCYHLTITTIIHCDFRKLDLLTLTIIRAFYSLHPNKERKKMAKTKAGFNFFIKEGGHKLFKF